MPCQRHIPDRCGHRLRDVVHAVQPHDGALTLWLYSLTTLVWAAATFRDGRDAHPVRQYGGRRLWDDFERTLTWWHEAGEPGIERFGLAVTPDGWHAWLDDPGQPI
ncbi:hypothetical protein ACGFX4_38525 [Kitasatospora sp. NPDC048365]|uniref:hypothetical protein n=1 Tax=Kitasatospora sp. NPDC048365 TaxID=3364050 RepID=UPI003713B187